VSSYSAFCCALVCDLIVEKKRSMTADEGWIRHKMRATEPSRQLSALLAPPLPEKVGVQIVGIGLHVDAEQARLRFVLSKLRRKKR
jgi:hypothetical protein